MGELKEITLVKEGELHRLVLDQVTNLESTEYSDKVDLSRGEVLSPSGTFDSIATATNCLECHRGLEMHDMTGQRMEGVRMGNVAGKVVLITGAGAGIGRATARMFAAKGAKVVVTDVDEAGGRATVDSILSAGGEGLFLTHDVSSEEQWTRILADAESRFGGIDVLVNNAGIYIIAPLADTTLEQWNRLFSINVTGVFLGSKHVAPYLVKRGGGSIINMSSVAGLRGTAGHTLYGASKGAVRIMTKDIAAELANQNIRVNSIHPTYVKTAMADYGAAIAGLTLDEMGERMVPLGRLAEPDDVANVIVFLASDESNYLTGSEFVVDGGGTSIISV
ncbi:glucose 1-dehydrogenase [Ferrimicrobium sp.]|uniref:SDR family NAD(P)-dependent oxidoreductase n=1 Tax=Ferrimicrobium sp. TaxID=2926050 RepID=UPI0026271CB4|nr:glucose 1-dehydrogenase [Ferrimicrobium sp.]